MRKIMGLFFILIGVAIFLYPLYENMQYDREQQQLLDSFAQLGNTEQLEQASMQVEQTNEDKSDLLKGARGLISIDKIDLDMLIFDGTSTEALSKGIGMIEPQKEFGVNNIGLAGHRAITKGKQFNRLDELNVNDEIQVTTSIGTLEFAVVDTFVVHQSEVSVLNDQDEPLLTLVTCTPIGSRNPPHRLIVQAALVP
ncbi:class D sortase [Sporosarcina soli]|uniref:Class D sortase n=1 Tax=Sporosarcina soli TaxID=334736 RepID=A0ABW0THX1_9BACL